MTKKHFEYAARIVRDWPDYGTKEDLAYAFAELFQSFNPRFSRNRFLTACGIEAK